MPAHANLGLPDVRKNGFDYCARFRLIGGLFFRVTTHFLVLNSRRASRARRPGSGGRYGFTVGSTLVSL